MKAEPSKLAQLVIAYHEKFGRHVPELTLRLRDAGDLAAILQDSLTTGVPLSETEWDRVAPFKFRPCGGCIVCDENQESATPTKGPDGEWLQ
jgi:hypothetical protein